MGIALSGTPTRNGGGVHLLRRFRVGQKQRRRLAPLARNERRQPAGNLTLSGGTLFGTTLYSGGSPVPSGDGTVFALTLPTPESGTLALVGAGAVVFASYRWRKMR
jgi:hypothetical protein